MHVFLYEWITGGGLVEESGRLPASLLAEGSAMIAALAADFVAVPGAQVTVLRDMRLDHLLLPRCEVVEIDSAAQWREEFDRLAATADRTMVVAPEFDGILRRTLRRLDEAGGRSLNASEEFVALASNKHRTAARLHGAGVPVPEGCVLEADEPKLPWDFRYPAVLKPIDGAGSQHTLLVHGPRDEPPPYPWPRRLERFCPGSAASAAAVCGRAGRLMLPPCWQRLSDDGRFAYHGGSTIDDAALAKRAAAIANRALDAMPPARGFVGVDLVLGEDPDGEEDVAIEINPRLTTSYVGLRAAVSQNLARAMIDAVDGRLTELTPRGAAVEFDAAGAVWTSQ
jgi:predicted ATP-grasp superfamily ATP-dependent carboligase